MSEHEAGCCCWDCVMEVEEWIREVAFERAMNELAETDRMIRMKQFPLSQQIEEVERELGKRREVYPRWVGSGKMRRGESEYHMARMESVLKTLKWLSDNQEAVKQVVAAKGEKQPEAASA